MSKSDANWSTVSSTSIESQLPQKSDFHGTILGRGTGEARTKCGVGGRWGIGGMGVGEAHGHGWVLGNGGGMFW